MRMLMNNLDAQVAENPDELIVYGGTGRAARSWEDFDRIVAALRDLENDETLLMQSGRPVGIVRTHGSTRFVIERTPNVHPRPQIRIEHARRCRGGNDWWQEKEVFVPVVRSI